jgi:hypothetical protein
MGLYEFFFPHQAQAESMRDMARAMRARTAGGRRETRRVRELEERVAELENDLDFLSLITLTLFYTMHEKGLIDRAKLLQRLQEIDLFDGTDDGKVSPEAFRKALGFSKE